MNPLKLKNISKKRNKDRIIGKNGYILVYCPNNPFCKHGYILEHKLVVEAKIGRLLNPGETIHHINGKKDDNNIDNLFLFKSQSEHRKFENKVKQFGFTRPILKQISERWNEFSL